MGDWWVEPKANRLSRDGESVTIEPRVMELLVYLASRAGEVVSSQEIFSQVWPNVVVGDNSLYQSIAQLRKVLGDSSMDPRYIATIPKRGYRIIAEVEAVAQPSEVVSIKEQTGSHVGAVEPSSTTRPPNTFRGLAFLISFVFIAAIGIGLLVHFGGDTPQNVGQHSDGRLTSIAVLPFTNISDDPSNDYFAVGVSDEILNTLAPVRGLNVVARTSSYAMKDAKDVREIGQRLNVQGVVEGSVRKTGDKIRVNVQLIDAATGYDIWSAEYDRNLDDVFQIEEEIAESILGALRDHLGARVTADVSPPEFTRIEAYDLYLLGRHYVRKRTPAALDRAIGLFRNAIRQDEGYAPAHSGLAKAYLLQSEYADLSLDVAVHLAEPAINKAKTLDENLDEAYGSLGLLRRYQRRYDEAKPALRTAIQLNPSYAEAYMWLALTLAEHEGRINDAPQHYERALGLDPLNKTILINIAYNLSRLGRYADALERLDLASQLLPRSVRIQLAIAQVAADFGKFDLAIEAAQRALDLRPDGARAMTMLAYSYANLEDPKSAEYWIARTERSGGDTSLWHLNLAKTALYVQKGELEKLDAFSRQSTQQSRKHDPLLFFAREWQMLGAAGTFSMLRGDYSAAARYFEKHLQSAGRPKVTQTSEDDVLFLVNLASVYAKMGQEEDFHAALEMAETVTTQARQNGWNTNLLTFFEARLQALKGKSEEAAAALKQAVDEGFLYHWWIRNDPIWTDFAEDKTFRRVMAEIKTRLSESMQRINKEISTTAATQ